MRIPERLVAALDAGELCLFVGAGVSVSCGLPDWRGLAEAVIRTLPRPPGPPLGAIAAAARQGLPAPADPNRLASEKTRILADEQPLLSMRYARREPGADVEAAVCNCLYGSPIVLSETVLEIARLDRVRRICCFNYDDLLDRAFAEHGRTYVPMFQNDRIPFETPDTLIFYPHGYLPDPKRGSFPRTTTIVLSEDDYFALYAAPYAWANLVQLTLLLNYTALFAGCSLLDPNLRRLLDVAAAARPDHEHFALFCDPQHREDAKWYQRMGAEAHGAVRTGLLRGLGVSPIRVDACADVAGLIRELRA